MLKLCTTKPSAWIIRHQSVRCSTFKKAQTLVVLASQRSEDNPPSTPAADVPPSSQIAGGNQEDLACYGTGSEVACVVQDDDNITSISGREDLKNKESMSLLETLLLISPFFFWGTSMVAMKELAPHTSPLFVAAWRLIPAGAVLLLWAKASGRKTPTSPIAWLSITLFAIADGACFQGFLVEGLQRTSAGLGSVIIDSQPLTVAFLASILFGERLGLVGYGGLILGVAGLLLLEVPLNVLVSLPSTLVDLSTASPSEVLESSNNIVNGASSWSLWDSGEWWMLLAAQSMAIGTVMVRWVAKYSDPVVATGWHMIIGGLPLLALAVSQEGGQVAENLGHITGLDLALLLYVSRLGSAASYGVFFYEATVRGNLTALSSLTFLTPMFAAAGGYLALGETLTPLQLFGAAVTLGAVTLISKGSEAETSSKTSKDA